MLAVCFGFAATGLVLLLATRSALGTAPSDASGPG